MRKINDNIATFDELLARFYSPSAAAKLTPRSRERLISDARSTHRGLVRNHQVLMDLLKACANGAPGRQDMEDFKKQIEDVRCFPAVSPSGRPSFG